MANTNRDPRQYEMMSILIPDMPEEETQAAVERIKGYLADANATVTEVLTDSPWGRRRLAYEMRYAGVDYRDGFYVLIHFSAQPHVLPEVERELKLDTQVIRYLLVTDDPKAGEKPGLQGEGAEGATTDGAEAPAAASTETAESATPAAAEAAPAETTAAEAPAADTATEDAPAAEAAASTTEDAPAEVATTGDQVEETAAAIEGEEAPAPADAPAATEDAPVAAEDAPVAKRSSKLPTDGEGTDWVAGDGTDAIPDGFPIKGNATSKIYHPQESPNYANTIAEIYFANGDAAERFGYRLPKTLQNAGAAAGAGLVRPDAASEEE